MEFLKSSDKGYHGQSYRNVEELIGQIVSNRWATLHDLQTVYSLEDAFIIWESGVIPLYNEYKAMKQAKEKAKRNGI